MAYIGPLPAETFTSFATQEFSTSATTSYTLDHAVTNENEIALFINNVRQQPGSGKAYTATGTALTLSAATASTDTMYAVFLGRALQTVNPADSSVGASQVADNLISGKTALAETPADTDELLVSDGGTLKRVDFSHLKGGGMDLLNVTTLGSDASEIIVDNCFTTSHDIYRFFLYNMKTSANADIHFQLRHGGASGTNDSGANYVTRNHYAYNNGDGQQQNSHNDGYAILNGWTDLDANTDYGTSVEMTLFDPVDTEKYTTLMARGTMYSGDGSYNEVVNDMMGWFTSKSNSHTGFRLHPSAGNFKQYTKLLTYGMKLS